MCVCGTDEFNTKTFHFHFHTTSTTINIFVLKTALPKCFPLLFLLFLLPYRSVLTTGLEGGGFIFGPNAAAGNVTIMALMLSFDPFSKHVSINASQIRDRSWYPSNILPRT